MLLEDLGALTGLFIALTGVTLAHYTDNARWDAMGSVAIGVLLIVDLDRARDRDEGPADRRVRRAGEAGRDHQRDHRVTRRRAGDPHEDRAHRSRRAARRGEGGVPLRPHDPTARRRRSTRPNAGSEPPSPKPASSTSSPTSTATSPPRTPRPRRWTSRYIDVTPRGARAAGLRGWPMRRRPVNLIWVMPAEGSRGPNQGSTGRGLRRGTSAASPRGRARPRAERS